MLTIFGSRLTEFDLIGHICEDGDSLPHPSVPAALQRAARVEGEAQKKAARPFRHALLVNMPTVMRVLAHGKLY